MSARPTGNDEGSTVRASDPGARVETCASCGGTGWFEDELHAGEPCPFCNGKGAFTVGPKPPEGE